MPERNTRNSLQQVQAVAAELKRVRESAGLSQTEMAARLGLDYAPEGRKVSTGRATVSAWESGRRAPDERYLKVYLETGGDPGILSSSTPLSDFYARAGTRVAEAAEPAGSSTTPTATSESDTVSTNGKPSMLDSTGHAALEDRTSLAFKHRVIGVVVAVAAIVATVIVIVSMKSGSERGATRDADSQAPRTAYTAAGGSSSTWTETTGTPAHTFSDATQLTGAGQPLGPRQSVQISCRKRGYVVQDGDPWWYRIESAPWSGHYYATSDAFYNNGAVTGPVDTGVVVDEQVPICA